MAYGVGQKLEIPNNITFAVQNKGKGNHRGRYNTQIRVYTRILLWCRYTYTGHDPSPRLFEVQSAASLLPLYLLTAEIGNDTPSWAQRKPYYSKVNIVTSTDWMLSWRFRWCWSLACPCDQICGHLTVSLPVSGSISISISISIFHYFLHSLSSCPYPYPYPRPFSFPFHHHVIPPHDTCDPEFDCDCRYRYLCCWYCTGIYYCDLHLYHPYRYPVSPPIFTRSKIETGQGSKKCQEVSRVKIGRFLVHTYRTCTSTVQYSTVLVKGVATEREAGGVDFQTQYDTVPQRFQDCKIRKSWLFRSGTAQISFPDLKDLNEERATQTTQTPHTPRWMFSLFEHSDLCEVVRWWAINAHHLDFLHTVTNVPSSQLWSFSFRTFGGALRGR